MKYPLRERIGNPELLIGRKKEFAELHQWIRRIPKRLSASIALLARKKSGKTAIVQRIFNELWSAGDSVLQDPNAIPVIPFYMEIGDKGVWYPNFAVEYYCAFASQYISYLERDEGLVLQPLTLEQIREYGKEHSIKVMVDNVESLWSCFEKKLYDSMWITASWAPHRFAGLHNRRVVVMIDEFQNISRYVFRDEACERNYDKTMAGSYHELAESKIAPMLVTGSYVGWLVNVINKYLEGGRLWQWGFSPYLADEEGLEAVYRYAEFYEEPINNTTAALINKLCMSDPF
ncbi:MAG: hypothetical protein GY757_17810, partial [bacterium]|nr:hypothetical protein [bacterium]